MKEVVPDKDIFQEFFDSFDQYTEEHYEAAPIVVDVPDVIEPGIYDILQKFDDLSYVRNVEAFTCSMCFELIAPSDGIVLRECIHEFCMQCLMGYIYSVRSITVKCPYKSDEYDCSELLQQRDIRGILPEIQFNALLEKSVLVRKAYLTKALS